VRQSLACDHALTARRRPQFAPDSLDRKTSDAVYFDQPRQQRHLRYGVEGGNMRPGIPTLVVLACAAFLAAPACAQTFPSKPVHLIVAYPAGGATDVIARAVGQRLGEIWNQQIIVENKGGAGTQIGAEYVAKSEPDGYTLLATAEATFVVNPFLYAKLSYDPKDLIPVSGMGIVNQMLLVNSTVPIKDVRDLIAQAKARPGELDYGTIGVGSSGHLNMVLFESMAGVKLTPVHYRGGAPVLTDLLGGHIPLAFLSLTLAAQPLKAGQLKALGIGSIRRSAQLPDVPTIDEAGVPGFDALTWFGLFAPKGTPPDVVAKINADVQRVLADASFREKFLAANSFEPITGGPDQFARMIDQEAAKWGKVIRDAKMTVD
jgi:tripartite-type tricarboxylate transporter receptor subunit TctC